VWDPEFKKYVELYAKDEGAFFKDFAAAFQVLFWGSFLFKTG
jgi:cytochrome c peroxidase